MIAAFDLASRIGWCCGAGDDTPAVGSRLLEPSGGEIGAYLLEFEGWLVRFLDSRRPDAVCFEKPVLAKFTTISATTKLQGLTAVFQLTCARRGLACHGVSIQEGRKALTGKANAKKPDETVPAAVAWGVPIKFHDEADALGLWISEVRRLRPQHAARWAGLAPLFEAAHA